MLTLLSCHTTHFATSQQSEHLIQQPRPKSDLIFIAQFMARLNYYKRRNTCKGDVLESTYGASHLEESIGNWAGRNLVNGDVDRFDE